MSLDSSILKVNCYCGKKTEINREEQEKIRKNYADNLDDEIPF